MKLTSLCGLKIKSDDTASTTEPTYVVSYEDIEAKGKGGDVMPGSSQGSLTGATAVTAVSAPSADMLCRQVTGISVYNADTVERTITIQHSDGTTDRNVVAMAVPSGRSLIYDGQKFLQSYEESSGDSRATSNSVVMSSNLSTGDSKATSLSTLTSTADSKGVSAATLDSTSLSTSDSKAVSLSTLTSTADSKAVSNSVIASSNLVTGDSKAASLSVQISTTDSTVASYHA